MAAVAWRRASGDPTTFARAVESPFSVAVRDEERGRLVLARDHLGEKPLYYTVTPGGVAFASEIKALLPHPDLRADLAAVEAVGPAAALSLFVLIGNPLIVMAIMGTMGYRKRTGFLAGLTVAQISEFSLILG